METELQTSQAGAADEFRPHIYIMKVQAWKHLQNLPLSLHL